MTSTDATPVELTATDLTVTYPSKSGQVNVLDKLTFEVPAGEIVSIVGPSGAGKTSLLRCLSGLMLPSAGRVEIDHLEIKEPPAGLGIVFQDYGRSLFPWMDVRSNVELPLRSMGISRNERMGLVSSSLAEVGLESFEALYPWQLSGGMQQRVAIARALACRPKVLMMDEPFASVDAQTRFDLEDLVLKVHSTHGMTVIVVTHDIDESIYLAQRVVVLGGKPSTVREVIRVGLDFPREQISTRGNPEFGNLRAQLFSALRR